MQYVVLRRSDAARQSMIRSPPHSPRLLGRSKIHSHMLRHACGFKLANDGVDTGALQAYLGHKSIQHTVRYTELGAARRMC